MHKTSLNFLTLHLFEKGGCLCMFPFFFGEVRDG